MNSYLNENMAVLLVLVLVSVPVSKSFHLKRSFVVLIPIGAGPPD